MWPVLERGTLNIISNRSQTRPRELFLAKVSPDRGAPQQRCNTCNTCNKDWSIQQFCHATECHRHELHAFQWRSVLGGAKIKTSKRFKRWGSKTDESGGVCLSCFHPRTLDLDCKLYLCKVLRCICVSTLGFCCDTCYDTCYPLSLSLSLGHSLSLSVNTWRVVNESWRLWVVLDLGLHSSTGVKQHRRIEGPIHSRWFTHTTSLRVDYKHLLVS